jgi:hypothetical protein
MLGSEIVRLHPPAAHPRGRSQSALRADFGEFGAKAARSAPVRRGSRRRHCARAARSRRGDPFHGKRSSVGRVRHTSRCRARSRLLAIPSPSADVESRVEGRLLFLVVCEAEQAPAMLAWLQPRSRSSSASCWRADSSATPGECGRLDTRRNSAPPRPKRNRTGCFSGLSGSSVRWGDGDSGAAEVDECDQGLGRVEAVAAVAREADLVV